MRILAVTPYYEPEGGGLERYAHAILSRLAARGHDVRAYAFTKNGLGNEVRDDVRVRRRPARWRLGNAPIDPSFRRTVSGAIHAAWPDVVLAHTPVPFPAEMAYLAARRERVPFVVTYHAGRLRGSRPALDGLAALDRWTLERRMLAGASGLVAVGPYVRDHALTRHRERVTVVPPGVDLDRFHEDGSPRGEEILFVGPLSRSYRWKGVDVLWQAFQRVRYNRPRARLTLVGDGDRFEEFVLRARGGKEGVRLAGRLSDEQLVKAYHRASVVVLPSTSEAESFGMVLAEANACGRPVVASRIGGVPDFVRDGENGLLAEPGDVQDLAEKIERVLEEPALARRLGQEGRKRVEAEHDWDALTQQTEGIIEDAQARR